MTRVRLGADGAQVQPTHLPTRRVRVSAGGIEHLAAACGLPSPVQDLAGHASSPTLLADRLGTTARPGESEADAPDDVGLMAAGGLLAEDGSATDLARSLLAVWQAPTLEVSTELVVTTPRGRGGRVRILACHRNVGSGVVCLSTADGRSYELAWLDAQDWWLELGRLAHLETSVLAPAQAGDALPAVLETPWELLVATSEAVASDRADLIGPLVSAHSGLTLAGPSADELVSATDAEAARWHDLLERNSRGTLQVTVAGAAVGTMGWVLFPDGWRSLSPLVREGWNTVRVERRSPVDLGREVAIRAAAVVT